MSALHITARNGNVETLKIILEGGADVEIRDEVSGFRIHTNSSYG